MNKIMFNRNVVKTSRIAALIMCLLTLIGCATGSSIVTGNVRSAIDPINVKLYLEPPSEYEIIGIVEASSDVELTAQAAQDRAIQELKSQAAKIGANGILITHTGEKLSDTVGFYSNGVFYADASEAKVARGRAIFVIQE